MTTALNVPYPESPTDDSRSIPVVRPPARSYRRAIMWLVAAWVVPITTHLLSVDWLIPPLVLLLTAGLLRGGRTLLDRLLLATGLLVGATTTAGLLSSFWPFRLEPAAIGIVAFTVLAVSALVTGRGLRWPRPNISDGLTVAAAVGVVGYLVRPYLRADLTGRLALVMVGEDNVRHFTVFESIRHLGGYLFLHPVEAADAYEGMRFYPQGWHLVSALLDNFARSSTELGPVHQALMHYVGFSLAGYGLFALTLLWAAQWIAGPLLTPWRRLPVIVLLAGTCVFGDLVRRFLAGYPAEVLGLTLLILLVALVARPVSSTREQMILVGGFLVGIGFVYYLLLPAAGLTALVWLIRYRRQAFQHRALLACLTAAVALATVPLALGVLLDDQGSALVQPVEGARISRDTVIALAAVIGAGAFTTAGRRLRAWRSYRLAAAAVLAPAGILFAYQQAVAGATSYYFEKALHAGWVTLLAGVGSVVLLLPVPRRTPAPQPRQRLATAVPAVLLTIAMAATLGAIAKDSPYRRTSDPTAPAPNWGRAWVSGRLVPAEKRTLAADITAIDRQYPHREGTITIVASDFWYYSYVQTVYLASLQRNSGETAKIVYGQGLGSVRSLEDLKQLLLRLPMPLRVVATSAETAAVISEVQRAKPPGQVELLPLPR